MQSSLDYQLTSDDVFFAVGCSNQVTQSSWRLPHEAEYLPHGEYHRIRFFLRLCAWFVVELSRVVVSGSTADPMKRFSPAQAADVRSVGWSSLFQTRFACFCKEGVLSLASNIEMFAKVLWHFPRATHFVIFLGCQSLQLSSLFSSSSVL